MPTIPFRIICCKNIKQRIILPISNMGPISHDTTHHPFSKTKKSFFLCSCPSCISLQMISVLVPYMTWGICWFCFQNVWLKMSFLGQYFITFTTIHTGSKLCSIKCPVRPSCVLKQKQKISWLGNERKKHTVLSYEALITYKYWNINGSSDRACWEYICMFDTPPVPK